VVEFKAKARSHPRCRPVHRQLQLYFRAEERGAAGSPAKARGRCTKDFYSPKSMFQRFLLAPSKFNRQGLTKNMLSWCGAKRQIDPVDYY
jgi:hypothetical protein